MTDERKALVKRLYGDLPDTMFEGHNVTDYDAVIRQNHEAADHIEAQAREIERLREALGDIANHPTGGVGCNPIGFVEAARAALEGTSND